MRKECDKKNSLFLDPNATGAKAALDPYVANICTLQTATVPYDG